MFSPDDAACIREAHATWQRLDPTARDADGLYANWWARPHDLPLPVDTSATPPLGGRLRVAHTGSRTWVSGAEVVAVGQAGVVVVATPGRTNRALSRGDYWLPSRPGLPARVGDEVVGVDRSGGYESDGWWRAWGGGWDLTRPAPDVTRLYLAIEPTRILDVARLLPGALDEAGIAWTLKTPSVSEALARADAAVCYVHDADLGVAGPVVARAMVGSLKPAHPIAFTAPLFPGVSWSQDPGGEESFGQVRCRLLVMPPASS